MIVIQQEQVGSQAIIGAVNPCMSDRYAAMGSDDKCKKFKVINQYH